MRCLGDRLGCVRVVVERPRDDGFLELLLGSVDPTIRYALDLRDPSWDGVEPRLAEAGMCGSTIGVVTRRWAYLRFRELVYPDTELAAIAAELDGLASVGTDVLAYLPPRRRAGRAACGAEGQGADGLTDHAVAETSTTSPPPSTSSSTPLT